MIVFLYREYAKFKKGIQGERFLPASQKSLADVKANFTRFELSTNFRSRDITGLISFQKGYFPLELLARLSNRNKILKTKNIQHISNSE